LSVTQTLVDFVIDLKYDHLPSEVIETAKLCLLDSLGCGLGGYRTELGRVIVEQVKETGGVRQASLLGDGTKIPCTQAAFANSAMINALDYDETFENIGHPGSTLIPAALAVGEHLKISGRKLIEAMVAAYEASIRIGRAIQPSPKRFKEVWFVGTWHTFGAVAAAGKLLGLDDRQMADAFGIAGAISPLPSANGWGPRPQTWVKEPTEWPAHAGVLAAQLAKRGFKGNRAILDGENGFWRMAGSDRCDFPSMTDGLGRVYLFLDISFKPYPTCRWIHTTLDATKDLVESNRLTPDHIAQVVVTSSSLHTMNEQLIDYEPATLIDAEFSTPYTVAMILMGIEPGHKWYDERTLRDSKVLSLAKRVRVQADDKADRIFFKEHKVVSTVEILTDTGEKLTARKEYAKGDPQKPMTRDELLKKFYTLGAQTLSVTKVKKLISSIETLETANDISHMTRHFY